MKFYYVAHEFNPEQPVKTLGGRRLAYYTKKHQAKDQCEALNSNWEKVRKSIKSPSKGKVYRIYCVEAKPKEIE